MKKKTIPLLLALLILTGLYFFDFDFNSITGALTGETVTTIESYVLDDGKIQLYFCPHQDCEGQLVAFIDSAQESIHCALFEIGLQSVQDKLMEKKAAGLDVKVVTDNDYLDEFDQDFVVEDSYGLMHNKFCVIDGKKTSSGSMNPTDNCAHKNNNNLLLIDSEVIAANYEAEFQEMYSGVFKKGSPATNPFVKIKINEIDNDDNNKEDDNNNNNNNNNDNNKVISIETYFCPDDGCADKVKEELEKAEQSIYFMTFSFTHQGIANMLLLKHNDGIPIHGVMEARQVSKYSVYEQLSYQGIDVIKDGNPNNMHHKVFIIDGKTVVTGSFNPTEGGDTRNDENVLIIHDEEIAQAFLEEWERVRNEGEAKNKI